MQNGYNRKRQICPTSLMSTEYKPVKVLAEIIMQSVLSDKNDALSVNFLSENKNGRYSN